MPTTSHHRRSFLVRSALAVTAIAALTACGSGGSGSTQAGASTSTPATTSATTATNPAPSESATATGSASVPATTSASKSAASSRPGDIPGTSGTPWTNPKYHVGFFRPPAGVGGEPDPVVVDFGQYVPPVPGTDGWGVKNTGKGDRLQLAPGARFYPLCRWSGLKGQADRDGLCKITHDQFVDMLTRDPKSPPEFWYTLDAQGRLDLLFQVYHS